MSRKFRRLLHRAIVALAVFLSCFVLTAVLLGGASLRGGKGNIVSTFVGVLVIGIMNNGMTLLSVPQFWQIFAKGVLMLLAVALDQLRERRSAARV